MNSDRSRHANAHAADSREDRLAGCLLGTAVGDAIGLPREGMSPHRAIRLFGEAPLGHRFLAGRGMASDDTEHACMVAASLLASHGQPRRFARSLAWRLRFWLAALPAGVGLATARAICKLWLGFPPSHSGVRSAGNGPAMRSPLIGVWAGGDMPRLRELVEASTRLTHTDVRAVEGAVAVALCCHYGTTRTAAEVDATEVFELLQREVTDAELLQALSATRSAVDRAIGPEEFVRDMGFQKGVSGYIVHTLSAALFCWLRHPGDFRAGIEEVVQMGGDADTTGAITGALCGATVGRRGIPAEWVKGLWEWPRTVAYMDRLAEALSESSPGGQGTNRVPRWFWPGVLPRNLLFLLVVLLHGLRRLFPPY
ncbi:MAG: ADP-ribosylglycohydrolase [Phycisphaerae bacterium]|nr:ADP-ribosylglycohydrolase [Phycisphaerae bacterium]